jgi:3-hydroxyisobutyrate dehydrogenase-like beta-hydroxyacid dehydrogenase
MRMVGQPTRFAVLGLGEAGAAIAASLAAAGAEVAGYDPAVAALATVRCRPSAAAAVADADVVLSLTSAAAAEQVAAAAMPAARSGAVWADLNTAQPAAKLRLADLAGRHGLLFADVALLEAVPPRGIGTPSLAAGPGEADYARAVVGRGAPVEVIDGPPGAAAARKLIRSTVLKGLAAAILEALAAARAAGCEDWLRDGLATRFGASTVDRLVTGSHRHAVRRVAEMDAAAELLRGLGVQPHISTAARAVLADLAADQVAHRPPAGAMAPPAGAMAPPADPGPGDGR